MLYECSMRFKRFKFSDSLQKIGKWRSAFAPAFHLKSDISQVPCGELYEEIIHFKQYADRPIQSRSSIFHNCQEQVISDNTDIW